MDKTPPKRQAKLPAGSGKSPVLQIRIKPDDRTKLQTAAEAAGMSLGAWLVSVGLRAAKRTERKAKA